MKRAIVILSVCVLVLPLLAWSTVQAESDVFPEVIPLPDGFQPEGITAGRGPNVLVGSLATGDIYQAHLRTGEGEIVVDAPEGRTAVGLWYETRSDTLFVAGGATGNGYVYEVTSGDTVAVLQLTEPGSFVNDVVVGGSHAFFTDSFRPVLYRVPLSSDGRPVTDGAVEELELTGDFEFVPGAFNANGIVSTPNGKALIVVNSTLGELYRVDPETGNATLIDLGEDTVPNGDGLLIDGRTLYVVQNQLNQIAVVELHRGLTSGTIVDIVTDPDFDVPTTITDFGNALYAVNARFGTEPGPDVAYQVVRVTKPTPGR